MVKKTIFFMQILLLLTAGSAFGADEYYPGSCGANPNVGRTFWFMGTGAKPWNGGGGVSWWDDTQGHFPPEANDVASLDNPLPIRCFINPDVNAVCLQLLVGNWPASGMSEGEGEYPIAAILDVNGGTLTVGEDLLMGLHDNLWPSDHAWGDVNIISGTVTVGCDLYIGREGVGELNMRGGSLTVGGTIWCPGWELPAYIGQDYEYGTGQLNLYGGTIEADDLMVYDEDGGITEIDIRGGTLILNGDKTSKITDLMNQGKLYHGTGGNIVFDYNTTNAGKTTVIGVFDPNRATYPAPGNYAKDVSRTTLLSWKAGASAAKHDVYFGTDFDDVNGANDPNTPPGRGRQDSNSHDPCDGNLASDEEYFWRIDEVNGLTTWRGNVWKFTTVNPDLASAPYPGNKATNIPIEAMLRWTKGIAANRHNVYLGTSFSDVNTSTTPTITTPDPCYTPPVNLLFDLTYYWRVDEVNTTAPEPNYWRGPVWKFTTRPYKPIEDFDNANTWTKGGNATVSRVTDSPFNDSNALKLVYDNSFSPWDSNATRSLSATTQNNPRNWVSGGVEILRIRFHGEGDNAVEQLYVTVKDAAGKSAKVLYSDSNDIVQWVNEIWRLWSIDLQEFSDVNLADIRKLTIGLGDGAEPGGSGTVYFDDIGLYRPMCLNQDGDADLNNDCVVDINDIFLLARDWLKTGYDVNAGPVSDANLILWYKFDEGSGYVAGNSSSYGAIYNGSMGRATWESPGHDGLTGKCVHFFSITSGDNMYIDVPAVAAPNDLGGHSTVALWIKDNGVETENVPVDEVGSQLFQAGRSGQGNLQADLPYNGYFQFTCGWDTENSWEDRVIWGEEGYNNPEHPLGQWVHYAFVKDATEGVMRIYQNGKIVAEQWDNTALKIPEVDPTNPDKYSRSWFTIGAWRWFEGTGGYYVGSMDDFRLYDRALSQQEIMTLAGVNSLHQPVLSSAEVTGDDTVNFKDFAVAAAEWLEKPLLWPY